LIPIPLDVDHGDELRPAVNDETAHMVVLTEDASSNKSVPELARRDSLGPILNLVHVAPSELVAATGSNRGKDSAVIAVVAGGDHGHDDVALAVAGHLIAV